MLGPCALVAEQVDERVLEMGTDDLVVAVRPTVELLGEDVTLLGRAEEPVGADRPQEGVADGTGHPPERAGADHEARQLVGKLGEHVAGEVVVHHARAAPEGGEHAHPLGRRLGAGGEVEELQPRRPALGPAGELGELLRRQPLAVLLVEQLLGLPGPEAKVVGADLHDAVVEAAPGEVEGGRAPRPEQHAQGRREVREQRESACSDALPARVWTSSTTQEHRAVEGVLELDEGVVDRRPGRGPEPTPLAQGTTEVGEQFRRRRLRRLGLVPRDGSLVGGGEVAEERRLARPGRRDDETEPAVQTASRASSRRGRGSPRRTGGRTLAASSGTPGAILSSGSSTGVPPARHHPGHTPALARRTRV